MLYTVLKPIVVVIMRLLFRLEGRGMQHVPKQGPVLMVANHSSFLDPPLVGGMSPRQLSFMAKAELFRIPLFGGLLRRLNTRPVRRDGADAGALRTALRTLQEGRVLLMFPEGTRGPEGTLREPKPGAAMLAVLSGAAVVPVFIQGSGRAWPRGQALPRPTKIVVTFGAPIVFERKDANGRKTDYEVVSRAMMAGIAALAGRTGVEAGDGAGFGGREVQYIDGRNGRHGEG